MQKKPQEAPIPAVFSALPSLSGSRKQILPVLTFRISLLQFPLTAIMVSSEIGRFPLRA